MSSMKNSLEHEKFGRLGTRLRSVIGEKISASRRYKELEERSSIPATNWRNFISGKQRPTMEMIEFALKEWPEHAFWVGTGITDHRHGHTDPYGAPDHVLDTIDGVWMERHAAARVFKAAIEKVAYIEARMQENPHFEMDEQLEGMAKQLSRLIRLREEEERTMNELEKDGN